MSKVILCVDDSVTMQTVAEITFRATDYQYVGARTVEEALDKARGQRPALVLADAVMPGKNGYDLSYALKADPSTAHIPVVILCGNAVPYDASRGAQVGADGSLTKPWDTQVMLDKVGELLEKFGQGGVARASGSAPTSSSSSAAVQIPAVSPGAVPTPLAAASSGPAASPAAAAAAAAAAAQKGQPPRSATIMGMPTIKMPGTPGGTGPSPAAPSTPSAPALAAAGAPAAVRAPAQTAPQLVQAPGAAAAQAPAREPGFGGLARPPMIAGIPTKKSILVERTLAKMGERLAELSGLPPASPELLALVKLSSEIVERVVWEVVPELAETMIREHLSELAQKRAN